MKETCDFKCLFDELPIPTWIFDNATLKFLEVNKAACKKYGYTRAEFLKMTLLDIRSTESKLALRRHFLLDRKERKQIARYWEHINKKGSTFYVEIHCSEIETGEQDATLVQAIDVNDRVLSEKENKELTANLQRQQNQYDDILSSVDGVVWAMDTVNDQLHYINKACYEVFGYRPSAMIADKNLFLNSIYPKDAERFYNSILEAKSKGHSKCTFRVYHKDGSLKTLKGSAVLTEGKNGEPDMLSGITLDITKQTEAEEMLRKMLAEEKHIKQRLATEGYNLQALINNTPDMIWSIDRDKRIITANNPFKKMIKATYNIEIGNGYDMNGILVSSDEYREWEEYYSKVFEGERFTIINQRNIKGVDIYLKISFNPIFDDNGSVIGASCFASDVTDQRTRLVRMQLQNERLKEIAHIQSHEVRGQVASLLGLAQLFNIEDPADPVNSEVLEGFKASLEKLDNIIREINSKTNMGEVSF